MSPEEIIETYYSALDRKDYATAHACESCGYLISYPATNMDNKRLYNDGFGEEGGAGLGNFLSSRCLESLGRSPTPATGWRIYGVGTGP